jgi:hypothetical protein
LISVAIALADTVATVTLVNVVPFKLMPIMRPVASDEIIVSLMSKFADAELPLTASVAAVVGAGIPRGRDTVGKLLPDSARDEYVALGIPSPVKNVHSDVSPEIWLRHTFTSVVQWNQNWESETRLCPNL